MFPFFAKLRLELGLRISVYDFLYVIPFFLIHMVFMVIE